MSIFLSNARASERIDVCGLLTEQLPQTCVDDAISLLTPEERGRCARLRVEAARRDFAVAHALLRRALVRYAHALPARWHYASSADGKPVIIDAQERTCEMVSFSLSHTRGCVACAVGTNAWVGIDVTRVNALPHASLVRDVCSAPEEQAVLEGADRGQREVAFAELWALKEAFLKAIGVGWAPPTPRVAFDLQRPRAIGFSPTAEYADRLWRCAVWAPAPAFRMAVVVGVSSDRPLTIAIHREDTGPISGLRTSDCSSGMRPFHEPSARTGYSLH